MIETLTLQSPALRCEIVPSLGGSLSGLWCGQQEILRHTPADQMRSGLDSASYPLVPYSNRVGYRKLQWDGQSYQLGANFLPEPHSIHGVGWMRPWEVAQATSSQAQLTYRHAGDAQWPFAFDSEQTLTLDGHILDLQMKVTNCAAIAAPAGLGWHPFFAKTAQTSIHFSSVRRWEMGADNLPTQALPHPGLDTDCTTLDVDHCFDGWSGTLQIVDGPLRIELRSDLSRLVVYTTPARDSIAIEPVSHVNNALAMAERGEATLEALGMQVLQPGQTMRASMQIRVEQAV